MSDRERRPCHPAPISTTLIPTQNPAHKACHTQAEQYRNTGIISLETLLGDTYLHFLHMVEYPSSVF
ncbi:hypothetical protein LDENG_00083940 [Lucifuga dentata]|nr:hypothetical protein LDENG_00083940 [Lucifuga dentata]